MNNKPTVEVPSKSICAVAPGVEVTVRVSLKEADESSGTHSESEYVMDMCRSSSLREVIKIHKGQRADTTWRLLGKFGSPLFIVRPQRVP